MKKFLSMLLAVACLITVATTAASADEIESTPLTQTDSYIEYYEDGSYAIITITSTVTSGTRATSTTKTASKIHNFYNADNELQWTYTLIGYFTITEGVSVVCSGSSYDSVIHVSSWSLTDHTNNASGNMAYGTATYTRKVFFVTSATQNLTMEMQCDVYGNIS